MGPAIEASDDPRNLPEGGLSSAEREILVLLWMCPETVERLEDMFVQDDLREFQRARGTVRQGLSSALHKLADLRLVAPVPTRENIPRTSASMEWQLTEHGTEVARRLNRARGGST